MFKRILQIILSRVAVLYVLAAILVLTVGNLPRAWNHVATSVLSRYMPSHDYLIAFNKDRTTFNFKKNKEFELYYRKLSQLMPELPDAYAMLGFCYFYDGKSEKALAAYQDAARLNPMVFNYFYNQGIIALKSSDQAHALEYFKKSVDVPAGINLQFIVTSHVYKPLLPNTGNPELLAQVMGEYSHDVYRRAYLAILFLAEARKDYATLLRYSRQGVAQGFLEAGMGNYYAGLASYGLKEYAAATSYMQEAIKKGFSYAQVFEVMGFSLQALKRPESVPALVASASLMRDKKIFKATSPSLELLIY